MPSNKIEDYEVLCTIGSGSYGVCKKIRRKSDGKIRVWKELNYGSMSDSEKQLLVSEVNLLRELKHNNIVRYHDRIIDKASTTIYIIMEFCDGGDLSQLISKHKKERRYIDEAFIWKVVYQISSALKECHRRSNLGCAVLHRDLKPANVFLTSTNDVKLGDFGLARVLHHETSFAKTFVGTPYYMSPELFSRTAYNEKSDIWSLGCLLYELCALQPPFLAANQKMLALKVKEGYFKPLPSQYSTDLQKVIQTLLTVDDDRRPCIDDILNSHLVKRNVTACYSNERKQSSVQPPPMSDALIKKEERLRMKELQLDEREKELERRERMLKEREKLADDKIARAECMASEARHRDLYPGHKRPANDYDMDKENAFHNLVPGRLPTNYRNAEVHRELKHDRALRFLDDQMDIGNRHLEYNMRLRKGKPLAGLR